MSNQERQFCLEYLITGAHQQQKNLDCVFCFPEKLQQEFEKIQQKLKEEQEEEKDLPDENEFDDAYEDLRKQAEEEEEEETQNLVEKKLEQQIGEKLHHIQQQSVEALDQLLQNEKNIEFILDTSMGLVINPNNVNESRFTLARRVLSLTLEKWYPQLNKNGNQQQRLENEQRYQQELKKEFNIYSSEQDVQLSKQLVQISQVQLADEFLENIQLHGRKDRVLSTLQSRIQNCPPQITSIIVFTDYTSKDYSAWKQQIEEAIKQRQNAPKIHIISFNLAGPEKQEDKQASFDFFESISKLTNGTFKQFSSL
ncbi:hypothetical protein TTHERM_00448720 (macronuclear) [Tetrahymena thermophila SB210]|uniref:Uncharacterized protein n=1 Tax=Tetrahymena thermophila (strain SB210) TaxID=312017 RepID=Q239E3_TETTS|nr:hypothetical protein TTHERM_00448720 [Tetrahymena thermophila SB210]EAR93027.3 hypothetical protein TTHERM_00448720 [Tetrahymena thermophila SB210]|eukprot:XP_001013272.3 hypothetical protein TTHERM_00448720 [Tetrahymena thermophila SB210]